MVLDEEHGASNPVSSNCGQFLFDSVKSVETESETSLSRSPFNPCEAAAYFGAKFSMSDEQIKLLNETLMNSGGDLLVIMKLNDCWLNKFGHSAAIPIFERLDCFEMLDGQRRSKGPYKWLFRFTDSDQISRCRTEIMSHHKDAFGNAAVVISTLASAGFPDVLNEHPMAKTFIFREIDALQYDVQDFPFFFNWPDSIE